MVAKSGVRIPTKVRDLSLLWNIPDRLLGQARLLFRGRQRLFL